MMNLKDVVKETYVVNDDDSSNPGNNHEVHTKVHAEILYINKYTVLGDFENCKEAL